MYAATTKDEGYAADGRFSAACQITLKVPISTTSYHTPEIL
jgi:hypothetical protein